MREIGDRGLYEKHHDHFGQDSPDVLVVQDATTSRARAEWEGLFRPDLASLLDDELIDCATDLDRPLRGAMVHRMPTSGVNRVFGSTDTLVMTVTIIPSMPSGWDPVAGFPAMSSPDRDARKSQAMSCPNRPSWVTTHRPLKYLTGRAASA
jgi:hypothetical protein